VVRLTHDDVAGRMELKGRWRKVSASRLEERRIGNPALKLFASNPESNGTNRQVAKNAERIRMKAEA
jgi:hypothetical protein